jgi:hydrogenase/urease accessory protein HupE
MRRLAILLGVLAALLGHSARSDEIRPGYLEMRQTASDTYSLLFKIPALGDDLRLAIYLNLPEGTSDVTPPQARFNGGAYTERRTIRRSGGLAGQTIAIKGLSGTSTDVLVRIESLGGATQTERLSPTKTTFVVQAAPDSSEVAATYLRLGIEHILFGFDHLLFVLALVILVWDWRRVALTVTAFTVAHSITLAAATLGLVNVPGPPVEAAIALSIVLVAVEIVNARRGMPSLTVRWPWLVAFCFGLLHGLGFAGALAEVGLPHHAIPIALLFFNLGVEIGQLVFVAAVLAAGELFRRVISLRLDPAQVQRTVNRLDVTAAYSVRSTPTTLFNARIGYKLDNGVRLQLDGLNIFNAKSNQIEYYCDSRLAFEPPGVSTADRHIPRGAARGAPHAGGVVWTSAADLKFLHHLQQARSGTSNR